MAGAVAVAGAATAVAALLLLFSSFSPVDKARELLPSRCWSAVSFMGWGASLAVELNHNNYFYCLYKKKLFSKIESRSGLPIVVDQKFQSLVSLKDMFAPQNNRFDCYFKMCLALPNARNSKIKLQKDDLNL